MKILPFIFLTFAQIAYAQYQNTFFVGGGIGFNDNKKKTYFAYDTRVSTFTASPNIGYFLNNNLAVGAGYEHFYQKTTKSYFFPPNNEKEIFTDYGQGFSAFVRHYWLFQPKFGIITTLQGSFLFGATFDNDAIKSSDYRKQNIALTPGIIFFPAQRFGIELNVNLLNYTYFSQKPTFDNSSITDFQEEGFSFVGNSLLPLGQIGFRYYFLKK